MIDMPTAALVAAGLVAATGLTTLLVSPRLAGARERDATRERLRSDAAAALLKQVLNRVESSSTPSTP